MVKGKDSENSSNEKKDIPCPKSKKPKSSTSFKRKEIQCLVSEFKKFSSILNSGTSKEKEICFETITSRLNKVSKFVRSVNEVKKIWANLSRDTTKSENWAEIRPTSGSAEQSADLSESPEKKSPTISRGFSSRPMSKKEEILSDLNEMDCPEASMFSNDSDCNYTSFHNPYEIRDFLNEFSPHSCEYSSDLLRIKKESNELTKRLVQIEEERRVEEKQKFMEEKPLLRLKKQKIELEIKLLKTELELERRLN